MRLIGLASVLAFAWTAVHAADAPSAREASSVSAAQGVEAVRLMNAGFESTSPGQLGAPEGWWTVQHAGPPSYTFTLDESTRKSGERSLRIENTGPEPYGTIFQPLSAERWRGKTLRFSAWMRTEKTTGNRFGSGAGLTFFSLRGGSPLQYAQMRTDAIKGTTEWQRYEVALTVPSDADRLEVGLTLYGPGIAWLDDASLDVVAPSPSAESAVVPPRPSPR